MTNSYRLHLILITFSMIFALAGCLQFGEDVSRDPGELIARNINDPGFKHDISPDETVDLNDSPVRNEELVHQLLERAHRNNRTGASVNLNRSESQRISELLAQDSSSLLYVNYRNETYLVAIREIPPTNQLIFT